MSIKNDDDNIWRLKNLIIFEAISFLTVSYKHLRISIRMIEKNEI